MTLENLSFDVYKPQPLLIVISGPSGVGKDAVLKSLKSRSLAMKFVVTAASRSPRPGEIHGLDYFFVSKEKFEEMIARDELIEYSVVYGEYKGIPKFQVMEALGSGKDSIVRVDVQGAGKLRKLFPGAVLIFLIPGNTGDWYQWIKNRKTETPESLAIRINTAREELQHLHEFDYVVVNTQDCLEETVDTIEDIINAEHHRIPHREISL
jgi:guanylate kinase